MGWQCPQCGRTFRNTNQWHSCEKKHLGEHLEGKNDNVLEIFQRVHDTAMDMGDVIIAPSKTSIQFRVKANFLSVRLKKKHMEMDFQLPHEDPDYPVVICKRVSSKRVWHSALIEDPSDVDDRVLGWVRESYQLITGVS